MIGLAAMRARPEPGYRSIVGWALLLALPLILVGLVASQLLEADYVVSHASARVEAERNAERLGSAVAAAVAALTQPLRDRIAAAERPDDATAAARDLLYANEASATLVRRDGRRLFPLEDGGWDLTAGMATQVRALETVAGSMSGWSFRFRDPFDRFVWARGGLQLASGDVVDLSGPMRGWRVAAAGPAAGGQGPWARLALALPIAAAWLVLVWSKIRQHRDQLAERAARADLVAKLSHDLRTPLANLKLYAELIARQAAAGSSGQDQPGHDKIADYCRVLGEEIDRLDGFAGNTIAFGTTAGRVRLDCAAPDDVVRAIVARLGKLLEAAGCRCELEGGASAPCRFDRAGFERILVNLLDNARKYAPGAIHVATTLDAKSLRLSVRDWGGGFSGARPVDGFGLGLAVVRDLATANGGGVELVRCTPGTRVDVTMRVSSMGQE